MISDKGISIKFLVFVLLCVFVSGDDAEVRCIAREREALLSFKNGLISDDGILSSWENDECCEWYGVVCSNTTRHVITLQLNTCDLEGVLQGKVGSSLLELHHLNYLDLSCNDFGGNPIPEFIGSMKQLQHLFLKYSHFSGIIPPQIGNLTNLRSLGLSYNSLTTENLDWLSNLSLLSFLDLSQIDLSQIPKSLSNFSRLRVLVLYETELRGHFEELFGNISAKGILESLQILDLANNKLNGSVPDLRAFSALTQVYLGGNNFTGSVPLSIGQLSKLEILDLSRNSLEGSVFESHFTKLDKLKILDLSLNSLILHVAPDWSPTFQLDAIILAGCNVGPSFPKWIQTQRNLSVLDLSRAGIRDEVPTWLWTISPSLDTLFLSDNQITGYVPNLSSTSISGLDLSNNKFSGPIPLFHANAKAILLNGNMFSGSISSICKSSQYRHLHNLDLSNNKLAGEIPNCWEKMPYLFSLNLADNSFSGEIPRSCGSLLDLHALQLRGNNLSGELPSTLRLCQRLKMLDVGGNELTGEIPTWIGELYNMGFLNLRGNKLHGSIPPQICNLTNIRILDLSINILSGEIPDCFNNFTALAQKITILDNWLGYYYGFQYNGNLPNTKIRPVYVYSAIRWKGRESEYRKNLRLLKLIDFSSNRLTGNIPKSFYSMLGLISLNLSRNSLTGNIIRDIGEMEMLECLDLSHNQFSGELPTSLAQLQYLAVLDLSNNDLFGKIPTSTQLQSFNASAYDENDGLCGPPLASCPEDSLRPSTTNPNEKDDGSLSFMQEVGISLGFGFIFGFWGVVGSFIVKKSWRIAYFNFWDAVGDWFYVRIAVFVSKWRRS